MSISNYRTNKVDKNQARKLVLQIMRHHSGNVNFSGHATSEMTNDGLTSGDIWNVLESSDARIVDEGEFEKGSYRYRLETNFIMVVIAFHPKGDGLNIVTVWDKRKKESKT